MASAAGGRSARLTGAGVEDGHADQVVTVVPDDDVVVPQLGVVGLRWIAEVHIEDIGLAVVARSEGAAGSVSQRREEGEEVRRVQDGHSCLLRLSDAARRVLRRR